MKQKLKGKVNVNLGISERISGVNLGRGKEGVNLP